MSAQFKVTGFFYQLSKYKCRKYLDIKRVGSNKRKPELMVVMMNPGSSYPLDGIDNNTSPSQAQPDSTQAQIMKVMNAAAINYARILNLSDLRTPDSDALYKFIKSNASKSVAHSIFASSRKAELNKLFIKNVPVIFGWGVNPALIPLAKQAIDSLAIKQPLGLQKAASTYSYYHPLPRVYAKQIQWVEDIACQLTSRLQR